MNLTKDNVEKIVDDLKEDLKIERFSQTDYIIDQLVSAFLEKEELEEANEYMHDILKDIQRSVEDV